MIAADYQHIWDCCCDHGLLGAALLSEKKPTATIHFVDIVPQLMHDLEKKLFQYYPPTLYPWQLHCIDVSTLPINNYSGRQLIIIAGVGGDLTIHFMEAIVAQHPNADMDFLLCPIHHQFSLRKFLRASDFRLVNEVLIKENNRFYELLLISRNENVEREVSPAGDTIWQPESEQQAREATEYLQKTLAHYQRIQLGDNALAEEAITEYKKLNIY